MKRSGAISLLILVASVASAQLAVLSGGDSSAGASVLLVSQGAALGAPGANNGTGAVYLYALPQGGWQNMDKPSATLLAPDGAPGDEFGSAMATAGSQLIVGAPGANGGSGAVYVYVNLTLTQKITQDSQFGCGLGASLSTSLSDPKWLLISSPNCFVDNAWGFATLYQFDGKQWQLVQQVMNTVQQGDIAAVAMGYGTEDMFGHPILALGLPVVGGVAGQVLVNSGAVKGQAWDFGSAISMQQSSNLLFVGEPSTATVYVYYGPNHQGHPYWAAGKLVARLTDSSLGPNSGFGSSISARGKAMLIGAPGAGVVDLFEQPLHMWADSDTPARRWQGAGGSAVAVEVGKLPQFISAGQGTGYVEGVQ